MGVLIRQVGDEWVVSLKEEWVFSVEDFGSFLGFIKDFKDVVFSVVVVDDVGSFLKVSFSNSVFRCKDVVVMRRVLNSVLEFKIKFGQLPEHRKKLYEEERY